MCFNETNLRLVIYVLFCSDDFPTFFSTTQVIQLIANQHKMKTLPYFMTNCIFSPVSKRLYL